MPQLFVLPRQRPLDSDANALAGALAYFYQTGTTTPQSVYSDAALETQHSNPVQALSSGEFPKIYLDANASANYRVRITSAAGEQLYQEDDIDRFAVSSSELGGSLYPQTESEEAAGIIPSNYSPVLVPDIERYGASTSATSSANTIAIQRAINANYGRTIIIPPGTYNVATTGSTSAPCGDALTITGQITIVFQGIVKGTNNCNVFKIAAGAQDVVTFIYEGGGIQGYGTYFELTNSNGSLIRCASGVPRIYQIKLIDPPQYALYSDGTDEGVIAETEIIGGPTSYIGDNHYGICLVDSSVGWKIDGNKTLASAAGGKVSQAIASLTFTTGEADKTQVINNRLFAQWEKGTYIFGVDGQCNNNWIYFCEHGEGIRWIGARPQIIGNTIRSCNSGGITVYDGQQAQVIGNAISDYGGVGIQLGYYTDVASKSLSRATIEANKIKGRTSGTSLLAAIDVRGHSSSATTEERISVRGNEIETANYTTSDERAGIHILPLTVTTTFAGLDVSNNVVAQTGSYGIRFGAGLYKYTKLEANRVHDPGMQNVALGGARSAYRWDNSVTWTGTHIRGNIALSESASSSMSYGFENVTLAGISSTEVSANMSRGHVTSGYLNMNNQTNDMSFNRQGDSGLTGTFTATAANATTVSNSNSKASMRVILYPTNAAAVALMVGANAFYFDGTVAAGTSFTLSTGAGGSAAGTETFAYELRA